MSLRNNRPRFKDPDHDSFDPYDGPPPKEESTGPGSGEAEGYEQRLQRVQKHLAQLATDVKEGGNKPAARNTAYKLLLGAMNDIEDAKEMLKRNAQLATVSR